MQRIVRKSLKDNTLQYTVQVSRSSESATGMKYSSFISSPKKGVQPIIFSFDSYDLLEAALKQAEKEYNPITVEIAFHEDRINTYKAQIEQHQARIDQLKDPNFTEDEDPDADIEMEMEDV